MDFFLALLAGVLSTLSPCVLPILPIIVSSALQDKAKGLIALVLGLSISFAIMGTFISYSAMMWNFDTNIIRNVSAVLILFFGLIMILDKWNMKFIEITSKLTNKGNDKLATHDSKGIKGQFSLGLLLGMVWVPCVGATLGTAIGLAVNGDSMVSAFITMLFFGIGAGLPLLLVGFASNLFKNKTSISLGAGKAKKILGFMLVLISLLVLTGFDKQLEILLLNNTPDWLLDLTTKF
jgi:cytochrome c-type biogenesis protein